MTSYWKQAIGTLVLSIGISCGNTSTEPSPGTGGSSTTGGGGTAGIANLAGAAGSPANSGGVPAAAGSSGMSALAGTGGTVGTAATGGAGAMLGGAGAGAGAGAASAGVANAGTAGAGVANAGAAGNAPLCLEQPVSHGSTGTVVELPIKLTLQGKPLLFSESNPLSNGGMLTPLDVRFYISEVALLRAAAEPLPVDVVTAAGTPAPYGVHLYSADDVATNALHVLAPAGEYIGIRFLLGLAQACNTRSPDASNPPLSATSQMSWPHTGFLFLRYQGRTTAASGDAASGGAGGTDAAGSVPPFPSVIHMGGNLYQELAPLVQVDGALSVPASGSFSKSMRLVLDEVFKGAMADVDLTGFIGPPGEEVVLGERLRRSMPGLHLFAFEP